MKDFTLRTYIKLLQELLAKGYSFQTLRDFIQQPEEKTAILRHDVDRKPGNSLKTARLEAGMGISATYYFRTIPHTFKPEIITQIGEIGHEIGYHYENLSDPQITQINADEGKKDFLWKARMNRMIGWKQLNVERGNGKEGLLWKGWMNRMNRMVGWKQLNMERGNGKEETAKWKEERANRK